MINRVKEYEDRSANSSLWPHNANDESPLRKQLRISEIENFAKQHPVALMAIGLAAGLSFGWWVKRT